MVTKLELHFLKLQNFVDKLSTNNKQAFVFATPPPRTRCYNLLLHERLTLTSKSSFFWILSEDHHLWCSLSQSLLCLVLRGVRITILGHSPKKYENSEKLSDRPPKAKNNNSPNRLPSTTTEELKNTWKFSFLLLKLWKLRNFEIFTKLCFVKLWNFFISGNNQLSKELQIFQPWKVNFTIAKKPTNRNPFFTISNETNC